MFLEDQVQGATGGICGIVGERAWRARQYRQMRRPGWMDEDDRCTPFEFLPDGIETRIRQIDSVIVAVQRDTVHVKDI